MSLFRSFKRNKKTAPAKYVITAVLIAYSLIGGGCSSTGELIGEDPIPNYFEKAYGEKNTYSRMMELDDSNFTEVKNNLQEGLLSETSMNTKEKEQEYKFINGLSFIPHQYFMFFISTSTAVPLNPQDVKISIIYKDGTSGIEFIRRGIMKRTYSNSYGSSTSFIYAWTIKLKKPYNKDDFGANTPFIFKFPDGSEARYTF